MMTRGQLIDRLLTKIPDDEIDDAMRWIDEYVATQTSKPAEVWTAAEVAAFIGAKNPAAARSTLSRWGIGSTGSRNRMALYPAHLVRETAVLKQMERTPR